MILSYYNTVFHPMQVFSTTITTKIIKNDFERKFSTKWGTWSYQNIENFVEQIVEYHIIFVRNKQNDIINILGTDQNAKKIIFCFQENKI